MDIVVDQPLGGNGLNGFRFGFFLRGQAMSVEHIEKISVASGIELVGPFQLDTTLLEQVGQDAVGNGRPNLGLDVITDNRNILCLKTLGPYGVAGDKYWYIVDKCNIGFQRAIRIKSGSFF